MSIKKSMRLARMNIEIVKAPPRIRSRQALTREQLRIERRWSRRDGKFGSLKAVGGCYYKSINGKLWPMAKCKCRCGDIRPYGCNRLLAGNVTMCGSCRFERTRSAV